jgi:hypothetical protein
VARRAADVDVNEIVPGWQLRRGGIRAGAAAQSGPTRPSSNLFQSSESCYTDREYR